MTTMLPTMKTPKASERQLKALQRLMKERGITLADLSTFTGKSASWLSVALRGAHIQSKPELSREDIRVIREAILGKQENPQ